MSFISDELSVISMIVSANVLKLVALPAVILKLRFATSEVSAFTIPDAASSLYVKSTLFSPLCNVIVSLAIALSKNLETTLSGKSPGPYTPLGLTIT